MLEETVAPSPEVQNHRNLRRLVLSIRSGFNQLNLLVAICDNPQYRDELIRIYEAELAMAGVDCLRVRLDRQMPSLKDALLELPALSGSGSGARLVTVLGADELLEVRLGEAKSAQEKFFFSVQWTREGLRAFPYPIVLWVTEQVAVGLAEDAPDFWSWRGGVFEFVRPVVYAAAIGDKVMDSRTHSIAESSAAIADPVELVEQIQALLASDSESPLLASLYSSLGHAYQARLDQGKTANYLLQETQLAVEAYEQAIKRQAHSATLALATSLNNLAGLYRAIGRYSEAEPLYKRALAISEAQLGPDHPSTGSSLNNLALLYESIGRYSEAEPLYLRTLQVFTQSLPEDHPNIKVAQSNFEYLLATANKAGQAHQLSDHPITQSILAQIQNTATA